MEARTRGTSTKPPLSTVQWIALIIAFLALLGIVYLAVQYLLGDEPPIRVRNGSLEIVLKKGEWNAEVDAWSPSDDKVVSGFTVSVESSAGYSCGAGQTGSGQEVSVSYTDGTQVSFKQAGSSGKIVVQPKGILRKASPRLLEHGQANDKDYINAVEVKGGVAPWTCEFESDKALRVIKIELM